jgi:effector-binding domain-containing protein
MTNLDQDLAADVEIVTPEERLALVVRKSIPMTDMARAQHEARTILAAELAAADVQPGEGHLTVWRMPQGGLIDYAPGKFVPKRFSLSHGASFMILPSERAAHLCLHGPYSQLPQAWQRLFEACRAQKLHLSGLNCEIYAPERASSDTPQTDLYAYLA